MSKKPHIYDAIFIDRDGTLNSDPGYISSLKDFQLYSFTLDALEKLSTLSSHLCIITNQSGISRGLIEKDELDKIHSYLIGKIEQENMAISGFMCVLISQGLDPNEGSLNLVCFLKLKKIYLLN